MTVVIAGAGPTGLTLACELVSRGVPCRVYDKAAGLFPGSRGKGLTPRTQEVFDQIGVGAQIRKGGMPFPSFRVYREHDIIAERTITEMLGTPIPTGPDIPYSQIWLIPQWRTDQILYDRLLELGGSVEFNAEITGFQQDSNGVTVTVNGTDTVRADYLVGADGGRSAVRKATGVGFAGETFPSERTLIGDVRADGLEGVFCHILGKEGGDRFSLWSLPDSPYYQFVATMPTDDVPALTLESVQKLLADRSGRDDIRLHDLHWISLYQVNVRMVDRFRVGRVFLAGDAAHIHSSAGGQGLNTSVQDAHNLGWKLAAVLAGAPDELLDSYEAERMPVAAQVLDLSTELHRRSFQPTVEPAPAIHQLDITYRDGPLALDDRTTPGRLRAGDRAPDAVLPNGRLFDVLRGCTLLTFGVDAPDIPGVRVQPMEPSDAYDVAGCLVLVRPDGYIGAISPSPATIRSYLKRVQ